VEIASQQAVEATRHVPALFEADHEKLRGLGRRAGNVLQVFEQLAHRSILDVPLIHKSCRVAASTVCFAHLAIVRMQLAGDQLHQGRFALAVATDDACPLVRLDRQIDVFEQERAADAEVDVLPLDKRHPLVVAAGTLKAAFQSFDLFERLL